MTLRHTSPHTRRLIWWTQVMACPDSMPETCYWTLLARKGAVSGTHTIKLAFTEVYCIGCFLGVLCNKGVSWSFKGGGEPIFIFQYWNVLRIHTDANIRLSASAVNDTNINGSLNIHTDTCLRILTDTVNFAKLIFNINFNFIPVFSSQPPTPPLYHPTTHSPRPKK